MDYWARGMERHGTALAGIGAMFDSLANDLAIMLLAFGPSATAFSVLEMTRAKLRERDMEERRLREAQLSKLSKIRTAEGTRARLVLRSRRR